MGINGLLSLAQNAITPLTEARAASLGAQAQANKEKIGMALQQAQLERQQQQANIEAALKGAQMKHLDAQTQALAKPPKAKLTPRNFMVDGTPVVGFSDEDGNLFDAQHQPVHGAVTPYEAPHEEQIVPIVADGKRVYATRKDALGKEAPSPAVSDGLVQVQMPDGSIVYAPKSQAAGMQAPRPNNAGAASLRKSIADNESQLKVIDDAVREMDAHPTAVGTKRGLGDFVPFTGNIADKVNQETDPKGVNARASLANISSLVIKDRSGAAVTASEFPRLAPFIPRISDAPAVAKQKLAKLKQAIAEENAAIREQMGGSAPALRSAPAASRGDVDLREPDGAPSSRTKDYGIFGPGSDEPRRSLPRGPSRVP